MTCIDGLFVLSISHVLILMVNLLYVAAEDKDHSFFHINPLQCHLSQQRKWGRESTGRRANTQWKSERLLTPIRMPSDHRNQKRADCKYSSATFSLQYLIAGCKLGGPQWMRRRVGFGPR